MTETEKKIYDILFGAFGMVTNHPEETIEQSSKEIAALFDTRSRAEIEKEIKGLKRSITKQKYQLSTWDISDNDEENLMAGLSWCDFRIEGLNWVLKEENK